MAQYRKRPVVIEAVQVPTSADDTAGWQALSRHMELQVGPEPPAIATWEGTLQSSPGDWIIRGVKGELYPVAPEVFAATYEAVEAAVPA